jgi:hypothetical protein
MVYSGALRFETTGVVAYLTFILCYRNCFLCYGCSLMCFLERVCCVALSSVGNPALSATSSNQYLTDSLPDLSSYECGSDAGCSQVQSKLRQCSLTRFARDVYSPLLQNTVTKVIHHTDSCQVCRAAEDAQLRVKHNRMSAVGHLYCAACL